MTINEWFQQAKKISYWTTENEPKSSEYLGKLVYGGLILLMLYRWYIGKTITSLTLSPLMDPEVDNTFWLILATGIPEMLIQNPTLGLAFDIIVFALAGLGFLRKDKRSVTWLFLILFLFHTITIEAYSGSHSKIAVCIFITLLPFGFTGERWVRLWEFARYYLAFVMVNSAVAKLYFGGLFTSNQMTNILTHQHVELQILAPNSVQTKMIQFLISTPTFTNSLYFLGFISQLVFIVAFFTRKIDKALTIILISFVILTHITMRITNADLLYMILPLWFSLAYYQRPTSHQNHFSQTTIIINRN